MVVKLNIPQLVPDEDAFIDSVVEQRTVEPNKTYFNNYAGNWKLRVSEYLDNLGNPENIIDSTITTISDKNRFINLYGSKDDNYIQKPIIDSLRERELQFCPSCGEDGTPNTLDHYLPKKPYPEFSILSKNLFPMCDICQGEKGVKTVDDNGDKIFIHPYYDGFAENQIIELKISVPYQSPTNFKIEAVSGLSIDQQSLVNRHITELNLQQRYSKYFKNQYMRLLKLVSGIRGRNANVKDSIINFHDMEQMKATNSWGHIFYAGVLADNDLLEYLETGKLPDFL
jgi:hypothetical protein